MPRPVNELTRNRRRFQAWDRWLTARVYGFERRALTAVLLPFSYPFGSPLVCCGLVPAVGLAAIGVATASYWLLAVIPSLVVWLAMSIALYSGKYLDAYVPYRASLTVVFALLQALLARCFLDRQAMLLLLGFVVTWIATAFPIVFFVKQWVYRARPLALHGFSVTPKRIGVFVLEGRGGNTRTSFPSGDAAGAGVVLTWWWLASDATRSGGGLWLPALGAVIFGLGRVYFGVHYVSDIVAGAAMGVASAALFFAGLQAASPLLEQSADYPFVFLLIVCAIGIPLDNVRKRFKRAETCEAA
jgi:membrane-associated phospholipid phosphatase